ncbi:hypothetical protein HBB16_05775 [Pseudonocardia sp. MCCB 268]|nr:hypothetical protein [Pseudonocardia cytotoxica]
MRRSLRALLYAVLTALAIPSRSRWRRAAVRGGVSGIVLAVFVGGGPHAVLRPGRLRPGDRARGGGRLPGRQVVVLGAFCRHGWAGTALLLVPVVTAAGVP